MKEKILFNIATFRREYLKGSLRRKDLPLNPLILFSKWLNDAYKAKLPDPNAMSIATVNKSGQPFQRIVLLKDFNDKGLIFYTNSFSRKIRHIINNDKVSLLFLWNALDRQVCFCGKAKKLHSNKNYKYFYSRPKDSQITAFFSKQSKIVPNRKFLEKKFYKLKKKFSDKIVPIPSTWSAWNITFNSVEFWQGGKNRLHDRFIYQFFHDRWYIYRLSP